MTQHISIDLETLGTANDACILSIGAVKFDPHTGKMGDTFYRVIDTEAAPGGGTLSASTVVWWMRQSQEARDAVFAKDVERVTLVAALVDFSEWLGFNEDLPEGQEFPENTLWQRGDKDREWLESAYKGMGLKAPFGWWQWNDQRTLCRFVPSETPRKGVHHNALDDAKHQAECVSAALQWVAAREAFLPPVHCPEAGTPTE